MNIKRGIKRLIIFLFLSIGLGLLIYGLFINEPLSLNERLILLIFYGLALLCFRYVFAGFKK